MQIKRAAILFPIFAAVCAFAFSAPPVYPGAKAVDELNDASKKAGTGVTSYNTMDTYEKVFEFYKNSGTEVQSRRPARQKEKFASFKFAGSDLGVTIVWKEDSKEHGTIIHVSRAR
jgi:hypothetical protein